MNTGQTSAPTDLGNVTLGNDLSFTDVTVTFGTPITQSGADWSANVTVSSTSASLAIGTGVSAQISGQGNSPGITGSYTLTNQPADHGAYQLTASQLDLTVSRLLTAHSSDITINYSPSAPAGQELVQIGSLSATLLPFNDTTATVDNLDIFDNRFTLGDAVITAPPITLGNILSIDKPSFTLSGVGYTAGAFTGTIGLSATSASLFPGQTDFSATVDNPSGTYTVESQTMALSADNFDLSVGKVLDAKAAQLSFTLDDSQSPPAATFDAKNLNLTSTDFPNATGMLSDLHADNTGFSVGLATLSYTGDVTLGKILDLTNPSLRVKNFAYTTATTTSPATVAGTIGVTADSVTMFPGQTSFTTTVGGLNASYDISTQVFALSATSFDLKVGKIFEANTTPTPTMTPTLSFTLDDSQSPPAVTFDAQNLTLTSTDFPNATGTLSDLHADNTGFSVGSVTLTDNGTLSLGGILSISGLSLGVENLSYTTSSSGSAPTIGGTITFGATSVSLFAGQSEFNTTISDPSGTSPSGLSGSYDINTQALKFQLDQVDISVSDIFKITADAVAVDIAPGSFALSVGSATVSVPRIAGFGGNVQNLTITNDGFNIGSATLSASGKINVGKVISITGPSATITNLGYSISNGAQFNGDVNVAFASASLSLSNAFQASVSGLSITIGLAVSDNGQLKVQADSASFQVGSYVTLKSKAFAINTAPGPMDDIASFQSVTATLSVGSLSFSGTGTNFAIDSGGNFVTLPGFSVSVDVSDPTNQLQWPSFLPIQVAKLALNWQDFKDYPSNLTIDLSASVNASLAGITLGGFVQDAVIDINKLKLGQFPVTSIGGAGISAGGTFVGVQLKAEAFLATATVNDQYGQPENVLYGGIDGGIEIAGLGGVELRLGLSQNGPLDASVRVDAPIILDPETGLALTGLRGGIKFDDTLTPPDSAKDLSKLVHQQFGDLTLDEWKNELAGQVATQAATGGSWTNLGTNFVIHAGATLFDAYASTYAFQLNGDIAFDTTGKILASGDVTLGNTVKVQGSVFLDLSQVASGKATIMINVTAPADYPIVTAYGSLNFEFDGPVLSPVQVPSGSSTPQLGTGLVLDGATGYGSASNINLNNSSYTVEFWAQRNATGQQEYVIGQAPPSSTTGLSIGFDTNNNFVVNSGGSTLSFPAGVDTSWHHWAVTFDATTGARTIYRDGISEASDTAKAIQNASTTLWIGKSGRNFYSGGVDEVRVWNVARAAADIQSNLALVTVTSTTGLLADWSFSEGKGTTAADSSGKGDTLTLSGGATWGPTTIAGASKLSSGATTPQLGSGLMLDGTDAYASATGIDLNNTSFSVEFWAKQNDTGRLEYIINQGDPPSAGGLQVGFDAGNNFFVSFGGSTLKTPTNDNNWHHWAVTFDLKTGQRVIYMDGKPAVSDTAQPITGASTTFLIGKSGSFYFDGNVDEVRVWTVARMETDIQNNMNSSAVDSTVGLLADWNFNDNQGTTAVDSSGNMHDATLAGGATWIQTVIDAAPTPPFLGFTITINGGVLLTIPEVPGDLAIVGSASFRVDISAASLQLNINGMVNLDPIGNALDLEGVMHFDLGSQPFTHPAPEFYGIFVLQTGQLFNTLSSYGLNVSGIAVLRFNTTTSDIKIDLPIPGSDPTQPEMIQHFIIPQTSVSLMVQGGINFQLQGNQWFAMSGTFDAIFQDPNNQPELDIFMNGSLQIGPQGAPIVQFDTMGFMRIWSGGIAAQIQVTFDLNASSILEKAGIDLTAPIDPLTGKPVVDQFFMELNTSGQNVSFTAPPITTPDPGLSGLSNGTTINIPAGAPNADGTTQSPGSYMVVAGSGGFTLDNSFTLIGSFNLLVTPSQFMAEVNARMLLQVQGNTLLNLQALGGIDITNQGIYGAVQLTVNAGLPTGYGFSLNAGLLLEVNTTTSGTPTIAGITLPTGPFVKIHATGDLLVGTIDVNGTFDFTASTAGVSVAASGYVTLGPLGALNVGGTLKVLAAQGNVSAGLVGLIQTNVSAGSSLSNTGFAFNAHFQFEINTTNAPQQVTGFVPEQINGTYTGNVIQNQTITIGPGVMMQIGGSLTLVSLITIAGEFDVTIAPTVLMVTLDAHLSGVLGMNFNVNHATFGIYADGTPGDGGVVGAGGIVINLPLSFSSTLGSQLFSISANPVFIVNTSPVQRQGIGANDYELDLNKANLSILGFTLSGTVDAKYTGGLFELDVPQSNPLSLSFFNVGNANVYGYLRSDGHFSLTGSAGFDLNDGHGDGIYGSFSITISDQGFSATASGGATVLNTNLASVSGTVDIEGTGVYLSATVYVAGIGFNFHIQFGTLGSQHPANQIYWYSVPAQGLEGGQVQLDAAATNPDGSTASSYAWTINGPNGFSQTLTGAEPMLTLGDPGTYSVKLSAGSGLTESSTIVAANVPPTISSLGTLLAYAAGVQQTITPVIVDPGPSDQNGGLKYVWSLTQNGQSYAPAGVNLAGSSLVFTPPLPSSTYGSPDIYKVYLTVTDTSGATATASSTFAAIDPANDTVTTAKDTLDVTQGTSLREAIDVQYTSAQSGYFAIKFAPSLAYQTITLSTIDDTTDHGNSAIKIASHEKIDLDATSVPGITITALQPAFGPLTRLFYLAPSAAVRIQGLTLAGGIAYGNEDQATGGAIYVDSSAFLFLENSTLINNQAIGALTNTASGPGYSGPVAGADGRGGAIFVNTAGSLFAANDTFANNVATGATSAQINYSYGTVTYYAGSAYGGAIEDFGGGIILSNDTIAANSVMSGSGPYPGVTPQGAGVFETNSAASFIYNSILSSNSGAPDYQAASLGSASGGHNVINNPGPGTPSGYIDSTANPLLGPLADHGHGVMTYSLLPGSPALSTGDPTTTFTEQFDGRGLPRFDSSGNVDIGAFEHQSYTVTNTNDSGPGSLRAAIAVDDDSSPISFAANLAGQTILLTSGPIELSHNITLTGPGANQLQIESAAGAAATLTPADLYKGEGNAADSAGGANGTIQGGVTFAAGRVGQAFQFNGTNSYIAVPPTADVTGSGAFAVSAWIKTGSDGVIIQQRDVSNFNGEYQLAVIGGKIYWWDFGNSQYGFNMTSTKVVADNNWHYVVAVRQANGTGQIYIDGQLDSSQAGAVVPAASNVNVYIGADVRDAYYGYPPYYFNGLIDEVTIYHSALTAIQAAAAYSAASGGRVFTVDPGVTASLTGLTIAGGVNPIGGGIDNSGNLTIGNSVLSSNVAQGASATGSGGTGLGGAIYNASGAVLTVTGSTFLLNSAIGGAGYASSSGTPGAGGSARGGAIDNAVGAQLYLANDTFSDNNAIAGTGAYSGAVFGYGAFGGAIDNNSTAYLVGTTIARGTVNSLAYSGTTYTGGAGIENEAGAKLWLFDTIVANDTGGNDVANLGTIAGNNNLVMTGTGLPAGVVAATADPQFEALGYNGGTTPTLALSPGSPAIGAGSTAALFPGILTGAADLWKAEGNALDSAGTARGTIQGSPGSVTFATGVAGQAFQFNGTNGYIAIPPTADVVGTGAFAVSAWIKTGSDGVIIQQRDASNFNGEYVLSVSGGKIYWWDFGNSQYGFNMYSTKTVADNNWHDIVAVRLANGTGQIYIDGQLDSSQPGAAVPIGSNVNVYIGADLRDVYYGYPPYYFNGLIDEVAIYHRALSASDAQTGYIVGPSHTQAAYNASTAPATVTGLAGWWSGNGNALDSTGRSPGATTAGVTYAQGQVGQAFQLDGQSGQVNIPNNAVLDTPAFSIGGWFELTRAPAANSEYYLASKYDGNYHGWILRVNGSLVPTLSLLASPNAYVNATSSAPLTLNTWYFIAATYDGATVTLFVNGVAKAAVSYSGAYAPSTGPLALGGASWFGGGYASTLIDEFTYYNRALSASDVQTVYLFGPTQPPAVFYPSAPPTTLGGLTGWWSGNGNALDSTGRDPATTSAGVTYAAGVSGQAFQLDGQSGQVTIPDNAVLDAPSLSISGWFQLTQAPAAGTEVYLASKYDGASHGWILRVTSALVPRFTLTQSTASGANAVSSQPLTLNTWYYISATYDGTTANIYLNGVLTGSATLATGYTPSPTPLVLGAASWYSGGFVKGLVDEFTTYSRALSPDEIQALSFNARGVPAVDERGFSRVVAGATDIGAYEVQPYVVTSTSDSGRGSLRQAVADDVSGDQPIVFAPTLTGQTITLKSPIEIAHNLTINGPGASQLTISGGKASEIFKIDSGTVTLSGLTLASGLAPQGGAISSAGSLVINNDVFSNDVAQGTASSSSAQGGAIFNAPGGVLTASGSTFNNDSALAATGGAAAGGAIENLGGVMTLTNDTLTANLAQGGASGSGGAIDNASTFNTDGSVNKAGSASIVNVTISANTVLSGAGKSPAPATSGAGLENEASANLTLYNTIVANDVGGPDVVNLGTVTGGNNMIPTSTGLPAGVVTITDNPLLGPLQNNGGLTPTMAPAGQSAALDNGDNLFAPAIDQNGSPRIIGGQVDIGAVEYSGPIYVLNTNDSGGDSLRSAIETAALYPSSTVVFDPSLAGQTITLSSEILLQNDVVIDASATPGVIISGGNTNRVFEVTPGVTVTLRDLTIENGTAGSGGAILNDGTLTLDSTTLTKNTASGSGGAVENDGTLTVIDSTIAGNAAGASGGGIDNAATLTLRSTTIAGNSAASGGGVSGTKGLISASNTIIATNNAVNGQSDFGAVLNSLGNNLIGNPSGTSGLTAHDLEKLDPKLGPLQNNGGPTPTMALLPGSPAIDAGTNTSTPANDQRGLPRIVNGVIDIGSFELQNSAPTADAGNGYTIRAGDSLTLNASDSTDPNGDALTYSWDINGDGVFGDASGATPTLTWAQLSAIGIQARLTPYVVRVLVSDGYGPTHQVTSDPVTLTVLPHLQVTALATTTSGSHAPVNSVTVTFAQAINASSFTKGALTLTRNGGTNLITHGVSVVAVSGSPAGYRIEGLAALTKPDGHYTLSINLARLTDLYGPGLGRSSITWTRDTTAPVSRVLPLPAKEPGLSFPVTVSATDRGPGATGVAYDQIYVSDNGGRSRLWTTVPGSAPTAVFTGKSGHTYGFRSVAHDLAGNVEKLPVKIEAKTTLPRTSAPSHPKRKEPAIAHVAARPAKLAGPAGPLAHAQRRSLIRSSSPRLEPLARVSARIHTIGR